MTGKSNVIPVDFNKNLCNEDAATFEDDLNKAVIKAVKNRVDIDIIYTYLFLMLQRCGAGYDKEK